MSIAAVTHRYVFGLKGDVKDNVNYIDEQNIVYPCGANTVIYNTEQKSQKFLPVSEKSEGITAMCMAPNKRYLAIAERSEKPILSVYDLHSLRKRKVIQPTEFESKEFVSVSFSSDAKYIATQTGAPDWTLSYWTWEKSKQMASVRTTNQYNSPVYQVSFNPHDTTQICVVGNGIFRLYRYTEGVLKQFAFQKLEPKNYLSHAWLSDDRLVIGTEDSKLLIFESGELKCEITNLFGPENDIPFGIDVISFFSKGFICGGAGGMVNIYERSDDREFYKKTRGFLVEERNGRVKNIALSPSEDSLICSLDNCQIYELTLSSTEVMKGDEVKFEILSQSFHHGQITGLDTCIRKPLIATCSSDKSVRIWNYLDNSIDLVKYFSEEAFSIAIHPSGLYILVGFSDKLRLMNLLIDDIRPYKEFTVRGCRECRFSNGGQYFAAVHGNTIQIYSTWTFENVANLKGHNGKVRSIYWTQDDAKIISSGMDGAVYDWNLKDNKREGENVLKSCSYTSAVCSPDGKNIYAVGSDKKLKDIHDSQVVREMEGNIIMTQVCMSHSGRMLFVGTATGTIRSIKFPLSADGGEFQEHQAHASAVTKLLISYDDQFLFSTSEDGSLYTFKISEKEGRGIKREKELLFAEEILVTKSDLEEKNTMMTELKTRVEELKMENEYQLRLKDMNYNEKIKEITEKFMQEIEALKITNTVLKTDKEKEEARHEEEIMEERERHQRELQEIETMNNQKLMAEYEKYQELQTKTMEMQEQWERQMREMEESREKALEELTEYYENKMKERQADNEQLQEEMRQQFREFDETKKEIEEDADTEIVEIKVKYERKLKEEREASLRLKGENGIMRKKFNTLQKEIEDHKSEIQKMFLEEKKLHSVIKSLEKDIQGLKKEIQERDETIQDKEKRIYDLKKKNQELEKFKFVLDYKIKELKKQIEPRENDILGMTQQIQEMDKELENYHTQNSGLDLNIEDLKLKLKASEKEIMAERQAVRDCEVIIKRFKVDLHNCIKNIQEPKILKEQLRNLYQKYCRDSVTNENLDHDVNKEYARQREYLERTVASLRRKLNKDVESHRADNVRIMQENVALIKEINQLRRELKSLKQRERAMELVQNAQESSGRNRVAFVDLSGISPEMKQEFEAQKEEIRNLRGRIYELEAPPSTTRPYSAAEPRNLKDETVLPPVASSVSNAIAPPVTFTTLPSIVA